MGFLLRALRVCAVSHLPYTLDPFCPTRKGSECQPWKILSLVLVIPMILTSHTHTTFHKSSCLFVSGAMFGLFSRGLLSLGERVEASASWQSLQTLQPRTLTPGLQLWQHHRGTRGNRMHTHTYVYNVYIYTHICIYIYIYVCTW